MASVVVGIECGVCGYKPKPEEDIKPEYGDRCPICKQQDNWVKIGAMMRENKKDVTTATTKVTPNVASLNINLGLTDVQKKQTREIIREELKKINENRAIG